MCGCFGFGDIFRDSTKTSQGRYYLETVEGKDEILGFGDVLVDPLISGLKDYDVGGTLLETWIFVLFWKIPQVILGNCGGYAEDDQRKSCDFFLLLAMSDAMTGMFIHFVNTKCTVVDE